MFQENIVNLKFYVYITKTVNFFIELSKRFYFCISLTQLGWDVRGTEDERLNTT